MIPLFLLLLVMPAALPAQTRALPPIKHIKTLYSQKRYREIIAEIPSSPSNSPELDLYRGLALARLERWEEARTAFEAGLAKQPNNEQFWVELAGVDYRLNHFPKAEHELRRALKLNPGDAYARNFLATIYLMQGNLEAALSQWNRIGKPQITGIRMEPRPHLRNQLLQRAFTFPPLGTLRLSDLQTTEALLDNLDVFPTYRFGLSPHSSGSFTVDFGSIENNGWGSSTLDRLARLLRDLPTAIRPEYFNLGGSAINITSLFRWDKNKRRVSAAISMPLDENPRWRFTLQADARNENWNLSRTFRDGLTPFSFLNLEKIDFGPQLRSVQNARWSWQTGVVYAYRRFRDIGTLTPAAATFFTDGGSIEYRARTDYRILDMPERRLVVNSSVSAGFGKNFARGLGTFGRIEGSVGIRWYPKPQGQDLQTTLRFRAGRFFGPAALDQLYQLGIERDNNLWVRGISGTHNGLKGNAPMGREFVLWNWETDKTVYEDGILRIQLGPFFDVGRIADPSGLFGSREWLWDPGLECKLRLFGNVNFILSYGRDLHSGSGVFYESATP